MNLNDFIFEKEAKTFEKIEENVFFEDDIDIDNV